MKVALVLLFVFCCAQCYPKKSFVPVDKNANIAFINMEGGGGSRPGGDKQPPPQPMKPETPKIGPPTTVAPAPTSTKAPVAKPGPTQAPTPKPAHITPKPVNPPPNARPASTPGPGSVKQLVNFYDSQGKGSPIRPYSYSQAVKQG